MQFSVHEMQFSGPAPCEPDICCVPFTPDRFAEYKQLYNACFREMRTALQRTPVDWLQNISQLSNDEIFLLLKDDTIAGAVTLCKNEIDGLIVNEACRRRGLWLTVAPLGNGVYSPEKRCAHHAACCRMEPKCPSPVL